MFFLSVSNLVPRTIVSKIALFKNQDCLINKKYKNIHLIVTFLEKLTLKIVTLYRLLVIFFQHKITAELLEWRRLHILASILKECDIVNKKRAHSCREYPATNRIAPIT